MSTATVVNNITHQTLTYAPAVLGAVQAIEAVAPNLPGATKQQIVINQILAATGSVSTSLESSTNPTVAGIAGLVNLFVGILNATGIFQRKTVVPTPAPVPVPSIAPTPSVFPAPVTA